MSQSAAFKFVIECEGCKVEKEVDVDIDEDSSLCKICLWEKAKVEFTHLFYSIGRQEVDYVYENAEELGLDEEVDIEAIPLHQLPDCLYKSLRVVEAFFQFIKLEDVLEKK